MEQRPPWKRQPISFFFDQSDRRDWINAVTTMFLAHKKQRRTFREIAFADKKLAPHLPFQAADMVACRLRAITEFWVDGDSSKIWAKLDEALFKSTFAFFNKHKEEVFRAYLRGELHHH
jgi:sulfite reductase alpha subunit-like flavoprotein